MSYFRQRATATRFEGCAPGDYLAFSAWVSTDGLRPVQGRLTRRQARRVLGYSIADTAGPERLERLQSAAQMGLPSVRNEPDGP